MADPRESCPPTCKRIAVAICNPKISGVGPTNTKVILVGEAPGQEEDRRNENFVGTSGQLLNDVLAEVGLDRSKVRIINAVRCATPGENKKPVKNEINCCRRYLAEEILSIKPNVVGCLGAVAMESVLLRTGITKLKNTVFFSEEFNTKVIPIYHPAYVLRNPGEYKELLKGMLLLAEEAGSRGIVERAQTPTLRKDVATSDGIDKVLSSLEQAKAIVFDLETSSLSFLDAKILCIALSWKTGVGVTIKWDLLTRAHKERLKNVLLSDKLKINHNLKFDLQILKANGFEVKGPFFDTLIAASLIDENKRDKDLGSLTLEYLDLGEYWKELDDWKLKFCRKNKLSVKEFTFDLYPYPKLAKYAQHDADATFRLYKIFRKELEKIGLTDYFNKYSMTTLQLLNAMEYHGVSVDRPQLKKLIEQYLKKEKQALEKIHAFKYVKKYEQQRKQDCAKKLYNHWSHSRLLQSRYPNHKEYIQGLIDAPKREKEWKFNEKSPLQLGEVLFKVMGLPPVRMSEKSGKPSTDEKVLIELAEKHDVSFVKNILDHRGLAKFTATYLISTYQKSKADGRIHANYLQHRVVTGRLSCVKPNLQNIPRDAKDFKACLVADPGFVFVKGDLKQAEFRCWAHYSNDKDMIADIEAGLDIHKRTASDGFGIPESDVTDEQRTIAKSLVFGTMYGRGAKAIAKQFKISDDEAKSIQRKFFSRYPKAALWLDQQVELAKTQKYVRTWLGRYRRLPKIDSDQQNIRAEAEREAKNSPIQGLASNMNDYFMYRTWKIARKNGIDLHPAVTQHDAQIHLVPEKDVKKVIKIMHHVAATSFPKFRVKMALDIEVGPTLGTLEKVK